MSTKMKQNKKRLMIVPVLSLILMLMFSCLYADDGQKTAEQLKKMGIIAGAENGDFMPDKNLSRSEVAIIPARLNGLDTEAKSYDYEPAFKDSSQFPAWAKNYIDYARYRAWMFGDDKNNFNPSNNLNGEEVATILLRLLGYEKVQWTQNVKVLKDLTGVEIKKQFEPITRGELFKALWKAISEPVMKDGKIFLDKRDERLSAPTSHLQLQYNKALATTKLVTINADKYLMTGFSDGLATVTGLSDPATGKEASPFNYEYGFAFGKGFVVKKNDLYAYVGLDRKPITGYIFNSVGERSDHFVEVKINNKFGLMDENGDIVVDIKYERIINSDEDEDCFVLKVAKDYYIVDFDLD